MWGNPTIYHFDNYDLHSDINECEEGTHECDVNTKCSILKEAIAVQTVLAPLRKEYAQVLIPCYSIASALVCGVII